MTNTSGFSASRLRRAVNFRLRIKVRGTPPAFGRRDAWSHEELKTRLRRAITSRLTIGASRPDKEPAYGEQKVSYVGMTT